MRRVLRGRVSLARAAREVVRRGRAELSRRRERALLDTLADQPAQLLPEFLSFSAGDLLKHFRERSSPSFFTGFELAEATAAQQRVLFARETESLIESARLITREHRWPLLGFGVQDFGHPVDWHRDPLSGRIWPLDYHADIPLWHNDGSDIRVVWELNRLGHLLTLGRAYALTKDEHFAAEFFTQVESWREQNPVGRGANWACAMEVALRAMNLLASFSLFRSSPSLTEDRMVPLLTLFDQHGAHIRRNLEFSHVATSNHYLTDIAGLLWIAVMLPELAQAADWREWALREMLREMDKQILPDGADYEGATGYHCFVLELFLYSFILCRANQIQIEDSYWRKLEAMLFYLRGILRPDGFAPLIGDTDGSRVLPIVTRNANDRAYLLALGAALFQEPTFKIANSQIPEELLWILGGQGEAEHLALPDAQSPPAQAFPSAGTYVLRHDDLYLLFNAGPSDMDERGSHRHNDVLAIEVSACGTAFLVDPGSYVYTANLRERFLFRSTAYHSTVEVDGVEQNSTREEMPFVLGNEAQAAVIEWEVGLHNDTVAAEHFGYDRLPQPVQHKRRVSLNKRARCWFVSDQLTGEGEHDLVFRFHFAPGLQVELRPDDVVGVSDETTGARLLIQAGAKNALALKPDLDSLFSSRDYGAREHSASARWSVRTTMPFSLNFIIVPVAKNEDARERWNLVNNWED
jgi:hypothetical protein